ncbi:tubulin-specific chaperone D [Schistosoma bovis]|uniref:Tubulin-specific chaperone D n=1 Tax=Schistosoma bovis TaxID=6184 RepID=A0A430QDW6_SCHBO|nr:tubulin-specific chaperone D [Schistosoma bovis]
MVPFNLENLDSFGKKPIIERVIDLAKLYLFQDERTQEAAAFLLAHTVTRPDALHAQLPSVISFAIKNLGFTDVINVQDEKRVCGTLRSIANICKLGSRAELLPYASDLLGAVLQLPGDSSKGILLCRLETKVLQRICLLFCPPINTTWQYQRGCRSLQDNLESLLMNHDNKDSLVSTKVADHSLYTGFQNNISSDISGDCSLTMNYELSNTDEVAEVIDKLISALRSQFTGVIPVVLRALFYDERSGDHNYGSNVRDAGCYVCWAFARAYHPKDFVDYVVPIASSLVLVSLFDREVSVRRAASAAFQENVGRQGHFPHGIEVLTTCDYFSVGNRAHCYLQLSVSVAKFKEYVEPMIGHLVNVRLGHWDDSIRYLAACALGKLYIADPDYMMEVVLPQIINGSIKSTLHNQQGCIFGTGELLCASSSYVINEENLLKIKEIVPALKRANKFRGLSGELIRKATAHFIQKCAMARLPFHDDPIIEVWREFLDDCVGHKNPEVQLKRANKFRGLSGELIRKATAHFIQKCAMARLPFHDDPIIEVWREFLDDCVGHKNPEVQKATVNAYPHFLSTYLYNRNGELKLGYKDLLYRNFLLHLNTNSESELSGYLQIIGAAPSSLYCGHVADLLDTVTSACKSTSKTKFWVDSRGSALKALVQIIKNLGAHHSELNVTILKSTCYILLQSISDYTMDSRGDVGSLVREVGMKCLDSYIEFLVNNQYKELITSDMIEEVMTSIAQQAVEKIDRTRDVAGQVFAHLLHHESDCDDMIWNSANSTFHRFTKLLDFPEYRYRLILGLIIRCSTSALSAYFLDHESDQLFFVEVLKIVEQILQSFRQEERIVIPLFKFLDFLLNDPIVNSTVDPNSPILLQLTESVWNETKLNKDVQRIKAAIDVFGGMLQFTGPVRKRSLSLMMVMLGSRYPIIRKTTATELYEGLLVYELCSSELLDQVSSILTETIWEGDIEVVRPIRNQLCELFQVPVPRIASNTQNHTSPA